MGPATSIELPPRPKNVLKWNFWGPQINPKLEYGPMPNVMAALFHSSPSVCVASSAVTRHCSEGRRLNARRNHGISARPARNLYKFLHSVKGLKFITLIVHRCLQHVCRNYACHYVFIARRYASVLYAVMVCLSLCLSVCHESETSPA